MAINSAQGVPSGFKASLKSLSCTLKIPGLSKELIWISLPSFLTSVAFCAVIPICILPINVMGKLFGKLFSVSFSQPFLSYEIKIFGVLLAVLAVKTAGNGVFQSVFLRALEHVNASLAHTMKTSQALQSRNMNGDRSDYWSKYKASLKVIDILLVSLTVSYLRMLPFIGRFTTSLAVFWMTSRLMGTELSLTLASVALVVAAASPFFMFLLSIWQGSLLLGGELLQPYISNFIPKAQRAVFWRDYQWTVCTFFAPQLLLLGVPYIGPIAVTFMQASAAFLADLIESHRQHSGTTHDTENAPALCPTSSIPPKPAWQSVPVTAPDARTPASPFDLPEAAVGSLALAAASGASGLPLLRVPPRSGQSAVRGNGSDNSDPLSPGAANGSLSPAASPLGVANPVSQDSSPPEVGEASLPQHPSAPVPKTVLGLMASGLGEAAPSTSFQASRALRSPRSLEEGLRHRAAQLLQLHKSLLTPASPPTSPSAGVHPAADARELTLPGPEPRESATAARAATSVETPMGQKASGRKALSSSSPPAAACQGFGSPLDLGGERRPEIGVAGWTPPRSFSPPAAAGRGFDVLFDRDGGRRAEIGVAGWESPKTASHPAAAGQDQGVAVDRAGSQRPEIGVAGWESPKSASPPAAAGQDHVAAVDRAGGQRPETVLAASMDLNQEAPPLLPDVPGEVRESGKEQAVEEEGTPLYTAASKGQLEAVWCLLEEGVDIDTGSRTGHTPLCAAAHKGHLETVQYLVEKGAALDKASENGETPLFAAASTGNAEMVRCLVSLGADTEAAWEGTRTPLYVASLMGYLGVARCLIDGGADVNKGTIAGSSPLTVARNGGFVEIVKLLVKAGAEDPEARGHRLKGVGALRKGRLGRMDAKPKSGGKGKAEVDPVAVAAAEAAMAALLAEEEQEAAKKAAKMQKSKKKKLDAVVKAKPLAEELHPSLSPSSSPAPTVGLKDVPASSQFTPWAQALMQETAEGEPERIFPEAVTAMERPRGGGSSGARAGHVAGLSTGRSLMPPSALPAGAKPQRGREGGFGSPTAAAATGAAAGGRSGAGGRLSVMSGTEEPESHIPGPPSARPQLRAKLEERTRNLGHDAISTNTSRRFEETAALSPKHRLESALHNTQVPESHVPAIPPTPPHPRTSLPQSTAFLSLAHLSPPRRPPPCPPFLKQASPRAPSNILEPVAAKAPRGTYREVLGQGFDGGSGGSSSARRGSERDPSLVMPTPREEARAQLEASGPAPCRRLEISGPALYPVPEVSGPAPVRQTEGASPELFKIPEVSGPALLQLPRGSQEAQGPAQLQPAQQSPIPPRSVRRLASPSARLKEQFMCPITQELLVDPVIASDGFTYERSAIEGWLARKNTSPMTNEPLAHLTLVPNVSVLGAVQRLFPTRA